MRLAHFATWVIGWTVVITVGLGFYFWPGIMLLALTPFVPVAAAAGAANPLRANFAAIRFATRAVRVDGLRLATGDPRGLAAGRAQRVLHRGWIASFTSWLIVGFVAAWLLTAWSALFRSAGPVSGSERLPGFRGSTCATPTPA